METLRELYVKSWPQLFLFKKKHPDLSNPLLINISERYKKQNVKLFIVGQQTNTWYDDCKMSSDIGSVGKLISIYRDKFNLDMGGKKIEFWQAIRKLEKGLCIEKYSIVWSNLNRFDQNGKKPSGNIEDAMIEEFHALLPEEIEIAKPDIVVFFSGPNFDGHIEKLWSNVLFRAVPSFRQKQLAWVIHNDLPTNTFRTYHPGYFRRSNKFELLEKILSEIVRLSV